MVQMHNYFGPLGVLTRDIGAADLVTSFIRSFHPDRFGL